MIPEFESFESIKALAKMEMSVTQKLHGTNAQVYVYTNDDGVDDVIAGSRERWIYPHDDNFGFAAYVQANKEAFIKLLGPGRHFGEWCGKGINSGEGLDRKLFALFAWWRWEGKELPKNVVTVPLLYRGPVDLAKLDEVMADLKANGSKLAPGFMFPEGGVITIGGVRYKRVFKKEEVAWDKSPGNKGANPKLKVDFNYLCQPMRLEKLLSRDERYLREFPKNLPDIVKAYIADLEKESQIPGTPDEIASIKKAASTQIFTFIRTVMNELPLAG